MEMESLMWVRSEKVESAAASKVQRRPPQGQSKEENTRCTGHATQVLREEVRLRILRGKRGIKADSSGRGCGACAP